MTKATKVRIIVDICLFIAVFLVPWWLILIAVIFFLFRYNTFYEALFVGLIIDSLYSVPLAVFHNFRLVATLAALFLFITITYAKRLLILSR